MDTPMHPLARLAPALALAGVVWSAAAAPPAAPAAAAHAVEIKDGWVRPTPPGLAVTAAYFTLKSRTDDRLVGANSPLARRAELHATSVRAGVARMKPVPSLALKAGESVALAPGGVHLMLYGLENTLSPGQSVPLELRFEKAGVVHTRLAVRADDGSGQAHSAHPAHH
jgi:copper(I)-binding protein